MENFSNNKITTSILCLGNNFNGCLLKNDIEDCLKFTEIKNNLLKIFPLYKIKTGLKSCVIYNRKKEQRNEFFLWGRFFDEENENLEMEEKTLFPFSYKNFPLKNLIKKISLGDNHLLLLDSLGNLFSMGKGLHGELGLGENNLIKNSPSRILFDENIKFIKCFSGMKSSFVVSCNEIFKNINVIK